MRTAAALVLAWSVLSASAGALAVAAQARPVPPIERQAAPTPADSWNFEDEEIVADRWGSIARDQALDLTLMAAFFVLAFIGFFRKSATLKTATLVAAVVYLGLVKGQLISVVNIFAALHGNLPQFRFTLAWYLFAVTAIVSTVLWGRMYCGRVCAFGAMTQLLDRAVPVRLRLTVPPRIERHAAMVKYAVLGVTILYFLATGDSSIYRYVEPFWMFTGQATVGLWIALGALLVATVFVSNLYCRFLCPVGAFLGLLSNLTVFRIPRWSECNSCRICEKACEWGAIRGPRIVASECVRCDDCERLYADTEKCPHWIVIRRKSEVLALTRTGR